MIKQLIKLANHLDNKGFRKEADYLDSIITKIAEEEEEEAEEEKEEVKTKEMTMDELQELALQDTGPGPLRSPLLSKEQEEALKAKNE